MEQGAQPLAEAALPANATTRANTITVGIARDVRPQRHDRLTEACDAFALAQSDRQHLPVVLSVVRASSREGMSA